jgi:hypothetical protein
MAERKIDWYNREGWRELNKAYETLGKAAGFKVGDKVRVLRKANDYELGWCNGWSSEKDKYIGKVVEIDSVCFSGSVVIGSWVFPWFVLELVEPVSEKHTITIDGKSTEVSEDAYNEIKRFFN